MKGPIITIVVALALLVSVGDAQTTLSQTPSGGSANTAPGLAQSDLIRVITPRPGQQFAQTFVIVRFEVKSPTPASNFPNYRVQLDGQDPVLTTSPEYTFTGLTPGNHTITIQMVDANETPLPGSRIEVPFVVVAQQPRGAVEQPAPQSPQVARASLIPEPKNPDQQGAPAPPQAEAHAPLPTAGSSLPLLSVIGFGVLLGGIASALKTR